MRPLAALALLAGLAAAQNAPAGRFLVARKELPSPWFHKTVILLVQSDRKSAAGLIVNRRTTLPISRALAHVAEARGRSDPVFEGGPVGRDGCMALVRTSAAIPEAHPVLADIHLLSTEPQLRAALAKETGARTLRVYAGYAGWGPGQLRKEIEEGVWHVTAASPGLVFDADPETLWDRLTQRLDVRIARGRPHKIDVWQNVLPSIAARR